MRYIEGAPRCLECGRYLAQHTVGDGCSISRPLPRGALKQIAAKLRNVRRDIELALKKPSE